MLKAYSRSAGRCISCLSWTKQCYRCKTCSSLGDCVFSDGDGDLACVCAPIIRMCVRIDEAIRDTDDTSDSNATATGKSALRLADRIIKMWEISSTTEPPRIIKEQEQKEKAFGLKVCYAYSLPSHLLWIYWQQLISATLEDANYPNPSCEPLHIGIAQRIVVGPHRCLSVCLSICPAFSYRDPLKSELSDLTNEVQIVHDFPSES